MLLTILRQGIKWPCQFSAAKPAQTGTPRGRISGYPCSNAADGFRLISLSVNDGLAVDGWSDSSRDEREKKESSYSQPKYLNAVDLDVGTAIKNDERVQARPIATSSRTVPVSNLQTASLSAPAAPGLQSVLQEMRTEHSYISPWLAAEGLDQYTPPTDVAEAHLMITSILESAEDLSRDVLLEQLWPLLKQESVTQSLPSTTFVEILRTIEPEDDFLPLGAPYAQRIPKFQKLLRGRADKEMQRMINRRTIVMNICRIRMRRGGNFQRREFAQLLRCARNTYDGATATSVMWMMVNQNIQLDASSYKSLLEAKCWSDAWSPFERYNLRLYPRGKAIRRSQRGEIKRHGQLSLSTYKLGTQGLGKQVPNLVSRMIRSGIQADSDIIGYLITALARQGDLTGVKVALRSAWDVDVDTLGTTYRYGRKLSADSPLRPNENSLFVIAHAFGSNNDVATALRVVDFVAGKYSIEITAAVWEELMEWSYVLSTRRVKKQWPEHMQPGQLPTRTPDDIWNLFTSERYSCLPTLPLFDLKIRTSARRHAFWTFLKYACEAMEDLYEQQQELALDEEGTNSVLEKERASQQFLHFSYIQRWASMLLTGNRWRYSRNEVAWQQMYRELLPDIVDVFWRYRPPEGVSYTIDSGTVSLRDWEERSQATLRISEFSDAKSPDERHQQDPASFSFTATYPIKT